MTGYIYRGVEYSPSSAFVGVESKSGFMYRGVGYIKRNPMPTTLDKAKICYRGCRLAGVFAPEPNRSGAFWGRFAGYKLAH